VKTGNDFDIAICGGGMVGATLAGLLIAEPELKDARIALIEERFPEHAPGDEIDLRVSALSRASQRMLDRIGAWPLIPPTQRSAYQDMVVWDAHSQHNAADALRFSASNLGEPDLGHIIANPWIQWSALEAARHQRVTRYAAGLERMVLAPDGAQVRLNDGRHFSATLVIGADGARSASRQCVGINTQVRQYEQTAIVTHVQTQLPHHATAWQRFLPTGPLAFLPLRDGRCSIVWSTTPQEAERLMALRDAAFATELTQAFDQTLGEVTLTTQRAAFPLQWAQVDEYCRAHFVLVGDAAHSVHPLAGQGVNLGMMDAACLVQVLAEAKRQGAAMTDLAELRVLRRYERWRKSENTLALSLMDGINKLFSNDSSTLGVARRTGLRVMQNMSLLKRMLMLRALGMSGERPDLLKRQG
jgi:2-polyprenylphenol 6-hydroxylase